MMDLEALGAALEPTRKGLEAAGFELALADRDGRLRMTVIAAEGACEDCLVPKSLFRQMAGDEIAGAGLATLGEIEVVYPADARRPQS
jgi:hypothetical protein